ncbi:rasGAP-activating-like protein 1 isoform X2 [Sciurus carolinensis]|uniref:rasGAP-activating-like protein 1 isoform X2 n=1 Tax=Sciurus carolinensis TaxID=30640 RepID=UPI001FB25F65|nr:rasGAP-activating-like protein 1 isoform X2 [Sciurus carolinensis]
MLAQVAEVPAAVGERREAERTRWGRAAHLTVAPNREAKARGRGPTLRPGPPPAVAIRCPFSPSAGDSRGWAEPSRSVTSQSPSRSAAALGPSLHQEPLGSVRTTQGRVHRAPVCVSWCVGAGPLVVHSQCGPRAPSPLHPLQDSDGLAEPEPLLGRGVHGAPAPGFPPPGPVRAGRGHRRARRRHRQDLPDQGGHRGGPPGDRQLDQPEPCASGHRGARRDLPGGADAGGCAGSWSSLPRAPSQVEFPPQTLQQKPPNGWFRLLPFPGTEEDSGGSLGALRLKVRLTEDRVLPSQHYQPLMALLLESVRGPVEEDTASPLAVLEEVASGDCRRDLATTLVKLFLGQGLAGPLLDYLTRREVARTRDPNTLFRSNSLASKSMQQFMKLVGMRYLHEVLKPVVSRVFEERKYVELDPCKMDLSRARRISFKGAPSEDQVRESSLGLLTGYLGPIVDAIVGSVARCPPAMRRAFKQLRLCVEERFPQAEHQDVKYLAISGFLFLRFFAPAILTPKLFDLRDQHADPQTSRSLLLLAKAVQSIGNLGQQLGQGKELWMAPLHPFLLQSISRVRAFLDELVDVDGEEEAGGPARALVPPSVTLREGYLLKRKEEPAGLATRFAFKKRYFRLSGEDLSYAKSPECQVRSSIPVSHIRAVERVDEGAFQLPHVMQVVTQDGAGALHTTYLQCKNVNELNQWLSALRKASAPNQDKLAACHPGAFRGGRWTCCLQAERPAVGCSRTHSAVTLGDWSDPLDPDAETQMVYRQLLLGRDQLRMKFLEDSHLDTGLEADTGRGPSATHGTCPEFLTGQRAAAAHLLEVLADLDRAHEEFQRQGQVAPGPPGP